MPPPSLGQIADLFDGCAHVLIAGAGGGHDVYAGIPLWWRLREAGIRVSFASASFTDPIAMPGPPADPAGACYRVTPEAGIIGEAFAETSFAELHLARYLATENVPDPVVWTMPMAGALPFHAAYSWLVETLGVDAIVLVDGGNDSLMGGWEHGCGTAAEDGASMVAAAELPVDKKILLCAGLGTDARHGVGLADTLQAVAELTRVGAWLGVCALTSGDPAVEALRVAVEASNAGQSLRSTVANAIVAAADGDFGRVQTGTKSSGDSTVWVNPLMAMYWAFDLDAVVNRLAYASEMRATTTIRQAMNVVIGHRIANGIRPRAQIPL